MKFGCKKFSLSILTTFCLISLASPSLIAEGAGIQPETFQPYEKKGLSPLEQDKLEMEEDAIMDPVPG